ncbi:MULTISPECIES: hypothetical protein [Proteus]|nr:MULTISPECIES: hypothetical protein [Proteus]WPC97487.1 hypothetical protein R5P25_11445 [Proteus terrae]
MIAISIPVADMVDGERKEQKICSALLFALLITALNTVIFDNR